MFKKKLRIIVVLIFSAIVIAFLYPKPAVEFPEGSVSIFGGSDGYICKCIGYRTPLAKFIDMGSGVKEELLLKAKCYGIPYNCVDYQGPWNAWTEGK